MTFLEEKLQDDPLAAEITLHVRRHLRRAIRRRDGTAKDDLAMVFGLLPGEADRIGLHRALQAGNPFTEAARIIAEAATPQPHTVALGHDDRFLLMCLRWLTARKAAEPAFAQIAATDIRTLLVLSNAIDLANARTPGAGPNAGLLPILIEGETGTGKELLAKAIHEISVRAGLRTGRFHAVQVRGLDPTLVTDELFGHVRGAFTGAVGSRTGRIELADNGTLLIDEVGDLPPAAQVGLLRFLQEKTLSRIGRDEEHKVDVRIIAATWHDTESEATAVPPRFRLDLLHRLRGGWLRLPPLRERENAFQDVVPQIARSLGKVADPVMTRSATDALALYTWPGNLRELTTVLRVALASADGDTIRLEDLPHEMQERYLAQPITVRAPGILCDEANRAGPDPVEITARVSSLAQRIEATPCPARIPGLSETREFFDNIPDPSPEHQATVAGLDACLATAREARRLELMVGDWQQIVAADLPPPIREAIGPLQPQLLIRLERARGEFHAAQARLNLPSNPWWRILSEVSKLPIFAGVPGDKVREGIFWILRIIYSIAPEFAAEIKALAGTGGLDAVRSAVVREMKDKEGRTDDAARLPEGLPDGSHKHWNEADWRRVVAAFPSKAEACRVTGLSEKTVTRYLDKLGISERWGAPDAAQAIVVDAEQV